MSFSQLYLQECTPARFRGLALSAFQFWTSVGTLIGTIVDNFTAPIPSRASYLIPLGLIYIMPFIIAIGLVSPFVLIVRYILLASDFYFQIFIPESPRWLMDRGHIEKARKSLLWLRPNADGIDTEMQIIQAAIDEAKENSGKALFFEMFSNPVDRRRTLLAVAAVNTQAASGAM